MELEEHKRWAEETITDLKFLTVPCRDCGKDIWFAKSASGKFMPMDLTLNIHECPNRQPRERSFGGERGGFGRDRRGGGRDW